MASLFQAFRSSSMPKRLLRYALAKLELLDADALDMENLDFALGRNTVFEFRDVGIKLKKLETLLRLPPELRLQKARVLLLRVTIPMDFYTSPILIEVDGVDAKLRVLSSDRKPGRTPGSSAPESHDIVPDTVNLAQSFLDAQEPSERKQLEEALAAESQDLGASVSVSDDGSEDEPYGTGQPLSLPAFLADFLQGIVDRMQVKIKAVTFQADLEVPVDANSQTPEPVSFQVTLGDINIEGITAPVDQRDDAPTIVPKEGKRHVALNNVRAYLISEANVFSALAQSPSNMSPSLASSPSRTRNPPSREDTASAQQEYPNDPMTGSIHQDVDGLDDDDSDCDAPLEDSEEALGIPYDLPGKEEHQDEDGPATPRASVSHGIDESPERPMFHSIILPQDTPVESTAFETEVPQWASAEIGTRSMPEGLSTLQRAGHSSAGDQGPEITSQSTPESDSSRNGSVDDLTQSHLYTHEDAESMYMSAFSVQDTGPLLAPAQSLPPASPENVTESTGDSSTSVTASNTMPGGWYDDPQSSSTLEPELFSSTREQEHQENPHMVFGEKSSSYSDEFAVAESDIQKGAPECGPNQEDITTPKGPTKLVKEFLTLKTISIYIPSQNGQAVPGESVANLSQSLARSTYAQAPGAFSVHGQPSHAQDHQPATSTAPKNELENVLEVDLSPIFIYFDTSLGFLLAMVVGKLLEAIKSEPQTHPAQIQQAEARKPTDIKVTLQEVSVNFINQLGGVADTLERHLDPSAFIFDHEVLLNATLQNMVASLSHVEPDSKASDKDTAVKADTLVTEVEVESFRFGYANDDIVSFDKSMPMSTSVRDTLLSPNLDIGVKITQSNDNLRANVETLPLNIQVDLQRLDETFSWFGGLSSFLNMSTSMVSVHSPTKSTSMQSPKPKPRSVRFEAPLDPENRTAASENKINLRIGGARVELQGRECSVSAKTSAIKIVSREEGIGVGVRMLRFSGPHLRNSMAEPPVIADVEGLRLDYLVTPKDVDLERLLELITPSKAKFDQGDDEIMVDTLLRQRRKGSTLRTSVDKMTVGAKNIAQLVAIPNFWDEISKLSTVAKYLPEDDRPGLLTLGKIQKMDMSVDCGGQLGQFDASLDQLEVAHITIPSLVALSAYGATVKRNETEDLVNTYIPEDVPVRSPIIMARMIGDEIEPLIKLRLQNVAIEYRVRFVMDILGLEKDATPQDFEAGLAASVANLGDQAQAALRQHGEQAEKSKPGKPMTLDIGLTDCLLGLNPLNLPSKMIVALTDAHLELALPKDVETKAVLNITKSSILLIDDVAQAHEGSNAMKTRRRSSSTSKQVADICARGFVDVCYVSSSKVIFDITPGPDGDEHVEVSIRDDLLVLETCADSTQTLITLANALKPPTPPSKEVKYRTDVMPMNDLLSSISAEAFGRPEGEYDFDQDFAGAQEMAGSGSDAEYASEGSLQVDSQYYDDQEPEGEEMFDALKPSGMTYSTSMEDTEEGVLLSGLQASSRAASEGSGDDLVIHDDFYGASSSGLHPIAKTWNSDKNSYDRAPEELVRRSSLKVSVRDSHIIWNLFDGYDWVHTRDVINKAVHDVESKAMERQAQGEATNVYEEEIEDEEAIGDFLFNSIYIGIPANRDPQELAQAIDQELNDNATETGSIATTAVTGTTNRAARPHHPKPKHPRLHRSKHHKITFELQGVNMDLFSFPTELSKTESSIDVRVSNVDIFDHVPSSTWKKFATYDRDAGEREMGAPMVHLEILNVKPLSELPVSEIVLRATVLPLRLHVDQDALDFITRFFEFKDGNVPVHASPSDVPFIQRAEVHGIPVKLDFKPKRVDYAGLRSGHTSEFMNFITLEEARMVLRHAIIYGIPGFDRLGKTLNDLWTPDVRNNQLPRVIAGLAPVRSLVNIGSGFKDLVEVPIKEYQRDGRVIRSISKGAAAFARTTGTEMVKLGAKLAVGTQYALQGAEEMFSEQKQAEGNWDEEDSGSEEKKQISLYADPPPNVLQGLRGGYRSLARDVNMARDAIIAVPGEVMQSDSPGGAAKAVWKRAPTIVFRPAVGVSKAIGQTLMGATNTVDTQHRRRVDEKYKRH